MKVANSLFVYSLICFCLLTACTETETIAPPTQRANRILEFTVVNTPESIYGVVNDQDSTIKVYLPYYYYSTILEAAVTTSPNATVIPESGTLIEDLLPVITGDTIIYYTVTDKEGAAAKYRLVIETQQPVLTVNELTENAAEPATFNSSVMYGKYPIYAYIELTGANFFRTLNGAPISKVTFISEEGTVIPAVDANSSTTTSLTVAMPFNTGMPDGLYYVHIQCYSQSVTLQNPIRIQSPL